jgi:hypothetical protein
MADARSPGRRKRRYVGMSAGDGRYKPYLKVGWDHYNLGSWSTPREAAIARDRAILHFGLDLPLQVPVASRRLGPATPAELKLAGRLASKKRARATSRFVGVFRHGPGSWSAKIVLGYRALSVYGFDSEEAAALAYDRLSVYYRGPGGRRNFRHKQVRGASVEELRHQQGGRPLAFRAVVPKSSSEPRVVRPRQRHSTKLPRQVETCVKVGRGGKLLGRWAAPADEPAVPEALPTPRRKASRRRYRGINRGAGGRWHARLVTNAKLASAHGFLTAEQAAAAYDRMVLRYRGANAPRNFPDRDLPAASAEELREEQRVRRQTDGRYAIAHRRQPQYAVRDPARPKQAASSSAVLGGLPPGVFYNPLTKRRPFLAIISVNDQSLYLGTWVTPEQAALARDRAALHYFGPEYRHFHDREQALQAGPADAPTLTAQAFAEQKATTTSRFRGVHWAKGKWSATIVMHGKLKHIGRFLSEEQAARAWDKLALKLRDGKAKLNFHPRTGEELRGLKRLCDLDPDQFGDEGRRPKRSRRGNRGRARARG